MATEVTLKIHTKEVMRSINQSASRLMSEAVNEVRSTVLQTLSGSRSGRTYYVPGTRRTYTASAPGEAPAQATGELRQSINTAIEGKGKAIIGTVGTDKIQGKIMEFGTRVGSSPYIAPRPWLRVSFEKTVPKIKTIFGRRWFS